MEEVSEVLHASGFVRVKSIRQLEGRTFCKDPHCYDLLVFPNSVKRDLSDTRLLSDGRLVIQDKACCVGPCALRPLLADGGDVLVTGCFSAQTVAHVAAVAASAHTHDETHSSCANARGQTVMVCVGDTAQADELQKTIVKLGCKNVKLLSDSLESLDMSDVRLQKVSVMFLMPACSLSAVSNPVDYITRENRDPRLLLDLSHGSVSPEKLQELTSQQRKELQHLVQFPQVRAVLYSTCSVHSEENEEVLKTVLTPTQENHSTPPYRLSSPALLKDSSAEDEEECDEMKANFFRLEASDDNNGCFLAVLTRQPEPEVTETPQEVLARAAAKGLLDSLYPNQPIRKEGRGQRTRRAPANQRRFVRTRPRATQSDQSCVVKFLNREIEGSSSEPALGRQSPRSPSHYEKLSGSPRHSQGVFSSTGPAPFPSSYRKTSTRLVSTNDDPSLPVTPPPAPPKGRQEVLRPATITFPPVLLSNDGLLSQRRSHALPARPNPAHTYLKWRNSTPSLPRTQTLFRLSHLRPWL